jgi:hypothetical protein
MSHQDDADSSSLPLLNRTTYQPLWGGTPSHDSFLAASQKVSGLRGFTVSGGETGLVRFAIR